MATRAEDLLDGDLTTKQAQGKILTVLNAIKSIHASGHLESLKTQLLMSATDQRLFSDHCRAQLVPESSGVPYILSDTDPELLYTFKKLVNMMHHAEQALSNLASIEHHPRQYAATTAIAHSTTIIKNTYSLLHTLYTAADTVNNLGASFQAIFAPQFEELTPYFALLNNKIQSVTPMVMATSHPKKVGAIVGSILGKLPSDKPSASINGLSTIAAAVTAIPDFLNQMRAIIESETVPTKQDTKSVAAHHLAVKARASEMRKRMERFAEKSPLFRTGEYLNLIRSLGQEATDILKATAPLSAEAYYASVAKLNHFKHVFLPKFTAETLLLEQSMGLKPGIITQPVLDAAKSLYEQAASALDKHANQCDYIDAIQIKWNRWPMRMLRKIFIGNAEHFKQEPALKTEPDQSLLFDRHFIYAQQKHQQRHLKNAMVAQLEAKSGQTAFNAFMDLLQQENTFFNDGQLSYINPVKKMELGALFARCQSYIHQYDPTLDANIVRALHLSSEEIHAIQHQQQTPVSASLWSSVSSALCTTAWGALLVAKGMAGGTAMEIYHSNDFTKILAAKDTIATVISRKVANATLRVDMLEESMETFSKDLREKSSASRIPPPNSLISPLHRFVFEENTSEAKLYERIIDTQLQFKAINLATNAFHDFTTALRSYKSHGITNLSELSTNQRKLLRDYYAIFQPYIYHYTEKWADKSVEDLSRQLRFLLNGTIKTEDLNSLDSDALFLDIAINRLLDSNDSLETKLNTFMQTTAQRSLTDQEKYTQQLMTLQQAPKNLSPLEQPSATTTVMQAIAESKTSEHLHHFIHDSLIPSLQASLSDELLEALGFDNLILPYAVHDTDNERLKLYKELLNAFYCIENGTQQIESLAKKNPNLCFTDLISFGKGSIDAYQIAQSFAHLSKGLQRLNGSSSLHSTIQAGLNIVTPIQSIPYLGHSLLQKKLAYHNPYASLFWPLQVTFVNFTSKHSAAIARDPNSLSSLIEKSISDYLNQHQARFREIESELGYANHALDTAFNEINHEMIEKLRSFAHVKKADHPVILDTVSPLFQQQAHKLETVVGFLKYSQSHSLDAFGVLNTLQASPGIDFTQKDTQHFAQQQYLTIQPLLAQFNKKYTTSYLDGLSGTKEFTKGIVSILGDFNKANAISVQRYLEKSPFKRTLRKSLITLQSTKSKPVSIQHLTQTMKRAAMQVSEDPISIEIALQHLFLLPQKIERLKKGSDNSATISLNTTQRQEISKLLALLKNSGLKPSYMSNFLTAIKTLESNLQKGGASLNQALLETLPNLRDVHMAQIICKIDTVEFELGLRPGSVSTPLNDALDDFAQSLVQHLPQVSDQKDLELHLATHNVDLRVAAEQKRLKAIEEKLKIKETDPDLLVSQRLSLMRIQYLQTLKTEKVTLGKEKIEHFKRLVFEQKVDAFVMSDLRRKEPGAACNAVFNLMKANLMRHRDTLLQDVNIEDAIDAKVATSVMQHYQHFYKQVKTNLQHKGYYASLKQLEIDNATLSDEKNMLLGMFSTHSPFRQAIISDFTALDAKIPLIGTGHFEAQLQECHQSMATIKDKISRYKRLASAVAPFEQEHERLLRGISTSKGKHPLFLEQQKYLNRLLLTLADETISPTALRSTLSLCKENLQTYTKLLESSQILQEITSGLEEDIAKLSAFAEPREEEKEMELIKLTNIQYVAKTLGKTIEDSNLSLHERVQTLTQQIHARLGPEREKPQQPWYIQLFEKIIALFKKVLSCLGFFKNDKPENKPQDTTLSYRDKLETIRKNHPKETGDAETQSSDPSTVHHK